jgi:hypothetical protein
LDMCLKGLPVSILSSIGACEDGKQVGGSLGDVGGFSLK